MLKKIPSIISPEMIKILMEMGHGDEICISDGNFPAHKYGKRVIRMDGHCVPEILEAVLQFFPLDTNIEHPVILMDCDKKDNGFPMIWDAFRNVIIESEERNVFSEFKYIQRSDFYNRVSSCFAVIATSEAAHYANIILKKGVVLAYPQ